MYEQKTDSPLPKDQFTKQELLLAGEIEVVQFTPEKPISLIPILIAPGWGETKEVFTELAQKLCRAGRIVISFSHPRNKNREKLEHPYDNEELRKAHTIEVVASHLGFAQVDLIAHSEGGINGLLAAKYADSDFVRNIILCNPAGLIGDDTVLELLTRFSKKIAQNIGEALTDAEIRHRVMLGLREGGRYFFKNPRLALEEVRQIADTRTESLLRELHQRGIGIIVVHTVDDDGFPMARIQEHLVSAEHEEGFVDGVLTPSGGHDAITLQPDDFVLVFTEMLNALEQ